MTSISGVNKVVSAQGPVHSAYSPDKVRVMSVVLRTLGNALMDTYTHTVKPMLYFVVVVPLILAAFAIVTLANKVLLIFEQKIEIDEMPQNSSVIDENNTISAEDVNQKNLNNPPKPGRKSSEGSSGTGHTQATTATLQDHQRSGSVSSGLTVDLNSQPSPSSDSPLPSPPEIGVSPPIPLNNSGEIAPNNCFLNSAFQVILNNKMILEHFLHVLEGYSNIAQVVNEQDPNKKRMKLKAIEDLRSLFNSMLDMESRPVSKRESIDTMPARDFLAAFASHPGEFTATPRARFPELPDYLSYEQHDASEAFIKLCFTLSDYSWGTSWKEIVAVERTGETEFEADEESKKEARKIIEEWGSKYYLSLKDNGDQPVSFIPLSTTFLKGELSFEALAESYFEESYQEEGQILLGYVEGEDVLRTYKKLSKHFYFDKAPPFLFFSLTRLSPTGQSDERNVLNTPLVYTLPATHSLEGEKEYSLQSFIVHGGASCSQSDKTSGHYICYALKEGLWWKISDSTSHIVKDIEDLKSVLIKERVVMYTYVQKDLEKTKTLAC